LRKLQEETGLIAGALSWAPLERVWNRVLASMPGLSDGLSLLFYVELTLGAVCHHALEGGSAWHNAENAHITTTLSTPAYACPERGSMLALIGLFLYQIRGRSA